MNKTLQMAQQATKHIDDATKPIKSALDFSENMEKQMEPYESAVKLQKLVTRNMKVAMALHDLNQKTLAKAIGLAPSTVSLKFSNKVFWSLEDIAKASSFIGVKPEALVAGSGFEPETSGL